MTLPWIAIHLKSLFKLRDNRYVPVARTAQELRRQLGIGDATEVVISGIALDRHLERHWRHRLSSSSAEWLAKLLPACAITPNYSLLLNEPRSHHLFNRKRVALVNDEWAHAGVPAVPVLQALNQADWEFWHDYLSRHREIAMVSLEFQTGLASPDNGRYALARVAELQSSLGRPLHVVALGGLRFSRALVSDFDDWTVIDSTPFLWATKRRAAVWTGKKLRAALSPDSHPRKLFEHNARLRFDQLMASLNDRASEAA